MGLCFSNDATDTMGNKGPRPLETTNSGDHEKQQKKNSLNPSVTLDQFLHRPNLSNLGSSKNKHGVMQEGAHHLRNIFAVPLEAVNWATYKPPVYPKTEEEKEFIMEALKKNFVFESLHHKEIFPLMQAFEKITAAPGSVIIKEGDEGDYFYILSKGHCEYIVGNKVVGKAEPGDSFGELALLYTCPRAATVKAVGSADEQTTLFRVDQTSFRYILQKQTRESEDSKLALLRNVPFLQEVEPAQLNRLTNCMTPRPFTKGEYLSRKGDKAKHFFVIQEGRILATNIDVGGSHFEDTVWKEGDFGGESSLLYDKPRICDAIAQTDGMMFIIDAETFKQAVGSIQEIVVKSADKKRLVSSKLLFLFCPRSVYRGCISLDFPKCQRTIQYNNVLGPKTQSNEQTGIKVIKDSNFDSQSLNNMASLILERKYKAGEVILKEGEWTEAEFFLLRQGKVQIKRKDGSKNETMEGGGFFGDDLLLADAEAGKNGPKDPSTAMPTYTATAVEDTTVGALSLKDLRKVIDTVYLGKPQKRVYDSLVERGIPLTELKRHAILGAGTFGQVWLVSRMGSDGARRPYALKVQSKYELIQAGQAKAVVHEKSIMAQLHHPLISRLVATYKDDQLVYMLMGLVQGGELYSVIHTSRRDGMKEKHAIFYVAGIAEGLAYMHRRGFVYRDLKPENVLVDSQGYPVIVDFGFAKYVSDKTYTLW